MEIGDKIENGRLLTAATYNKVKGEKVEGGGKVEFSFPWKDNLDDLITQQGKDTVFALATAEARTRAQSIARGGKERGLSDEQVVAQMATWRPGFKLGMGDPTELALSAFDAMTQEQQAEIIAKLQAKRG